MTSGKNYLLNDQFPKTIKNATSTSDGLMSANDKSRLDSIFEFGILAKATDSNDGLMGKEDKSKLDTVEENANNYVHPNDSNNRHVTDVQINRWDSSSSYSNNVPTPTSIGGIVAGTTFDTMDYTTLFNKLLYPYLEPIISNINITPNIQTYEKGTSFNITRIKFNISAPELNDTQSISYDFMINDNHFHSLNTTNRQVDTSTLYGINNDASITVTVIDNINQQQKTFELINYKFVYPMYYGSINGSETIDEYRVKSKSKLIEDKGDISLQFTTNDQKMLFAYPKIYGELKSIYDANNFNILRTFKKQEVTITTNDLAHINYYVYTNDLTSVTDYNIRFEF